jgi:hypothetical protein
MVMYADSRTRRRSISAALHACSRTTKENSLQVLLAVHTRRLEMSVVKNLLAITATLSALGTASVLSAPTAGAAVTAGVETSVALKGGTAPACIKRNHASDGVTHRVDLRNDCGKPMWVKVIINRGPDSGCKGLKAGQSWRHEGIGTYNRTEVC